MKTKLFTLLLAICSVVLKAQVVSPFNGLEVQEKREFSFIVSAHWHGSSSNKSNYPANTILGNLDLINNQNSNFIFHLGDLFLKLNESKANYEKTLFSKLNAPFFNVVGNHDIEQNNYESNYGTSTYSFKVDNNIFIGLNTELKNGNIEGEQLMFLKNELKNEVKNVFIFIHRPLFTEGHEKLEGIFKGNTSSGSNFVSDVLPLLKQSNSNCYVFGGSIGGEAPASFFYHKEADNVSLIATAIRELPRDALLKVDVINGEVSFKTITLQNQKLYALEDYNLEFWSSNSGKEPFNYRLIPLYLWQMVSHRYFWYGLLWSLFGGLNIWFLRKIAQKRRFAKNN